MKCGHVIVEGLVRLFNVCFREEVVPAVKECMWCRYKRKGDKYDCNSFKGIILLSVVGKVHGRVLIKRVQLRKEEMEVRSSVG